MELNRKQRAAIKSLNTLKSLELLELDNLRELRKKLWTNHLPCKREQLGIEVHLLKDLMWGDGSDFKNFCRMSIGDFEEVLALVQSSITKQDSVMRNAVSPRIRLAVTLRYITSGDSYRSLELLSKVSKQTISKFIPDVLLSLYEALKNENLVTPDKPEDWIRVANDFQNLWNFPHTLGAMGGKHIEIKSSETAESECLSKVLFAVTNAHSKFLSIDVGPSERASDSTIFSSSYTFDALNSGKLNIPDDEVLPGCRQKVPFYFIGDDTFGLDKHVMKAYNRNMALNSRQLVFNYRLSRARMTVEMAFRRLCSRFRIFHCPMEQSSTTVDLIAKTCCVLHNFLSKDFLTPHSMFNEEDFQLPVTVTPLGLQDHPNCYKYAYRIREEVCRHLVIGEEVPSVWEK